MCIVKLSDKSRAMTGMIFSFLLNVFMRIIIQDCCYQDLVQTDGQNKYRIDAHLKGES